MHLKQRDPKMLALTPDSLNEERRRQILAAVPSSRMLPASPRMMPIPSTYQPSVKATQATMSLRLSAVPIAPVFPDGSGPLAKPAPYQRMSRAGTAPVAPSISRDITILRHGLNEVDLSACYGESAPLAAPRLSLGYRLCAACIGFGIGCSAIAFASLFF